MRLRQIFLGLVLGTAMAGVGVADIAPPDRLIQWGDLPDPVAQDFEDPYRDLSPTQVDEFITIVKLRQRLEEDSVAPTARPRIEARLAETEAAIGIDVDWLISQQWVVAERREAASWATNPALEGVSGALAGFLIPGPADEAGTAVAYLVPESGMCSHTPPPPSNQLVRLILPEPIAGLAMYQPVLAHGIFRNLEDTRRMMVVDGLTDMNSAWALELESLDELTFTGTERLWTRGSVQPEG
ncbi:MAG: DUF3299 domain-containing protein [Pseudomonadota bacterium]